MQMLDVRILGPLEVRNQGRPVEISAAKLRVLLVTLAVSTVSVPTDTLIDTLWPAGPPPGARTTVRGYVRRLRRLFETDTSDRTDPLIEFSHGGYRLRNSLDCWDFQRVIGQAASEVDVGAEQETLLRGLRLWRGPVLCDVLAEPLRQRVGSALDELRIQALLRCIDIDLARGRSAELLPELHELVARNPLREPLWARLVTALYRAGREAEALTTYERLRELLADSLGVDPGIELRTLHQRMLTGDPVLRSTSGFLTDSTAPRSPVGRLGLGGPARFAR